MSKFAYFAVGALVGAAGLATAAYLCKEDDSPQRSDDADSLMPDALVEVARHESGQLSGNTFRSE